MLSKGYVVVIAKGYRDDKQTDNERSMWSLIGSDVEVFESSPLVENEHFGFPLLPVFTRPNAPLPI